MILFFVKGERKLRLFSGCGLKLKANHTAAASSKHIGPSCMPPVPCTGFILHPPGRLKRRNGSIPNDEEIDAGDCRRDASLAVKAAKTNKFAPISVVVMDPDGSEIVTKRMDVCPVGARLLLLSYLFDWFIPFAGWQFFNLVTCPFIHPSCNPTRHATANGIQQACLRQGQHVRGGPDVLPSIRQQVPEGRRWHLSSSVRCVRSGS